ncbi:transglycosylase SLT domain-containing protein [Campylobacterota bacterium]
MVSSRLILLLCSSLLSAQESFEDYKKRQDHSFKKEKTHFIDFKKAEDDTFQSHLKQEKEAIASYKKRVRAFWPEADLGNAKKLVSYSKDLMTKRVIDFEKNKITIAKISSDKESAQEQLFKELDKTLELDNLQVFSESQLEQEINMISKRSKYVKTAKLDGQKLLKTPITDTSIKHKDITLVKEDNTYKLTYDLPKDSTYKRSFSYLAVAKSNAQRFRLQAQWLLAIMHCESSFNPMARSWVPAYGLMQIVPKSAGIDAYYFLYKKRRLLSASYLYNTKNNIETGSAYFHILYFKYLASIKNPMSRLYCAIAGYNTGAGNVARAFVGTNSVKSAAALINNMEPEKVYEYLLKHLRHDEPKEYLKKVRARSQTYKTLYKL